MMFNDTVARLLSLAITLYDAVKNHGAEQNREASEYALADIGVLQRFEHVFTETLGADQRSDQPPSPGST